jgi:RNA polymerase sigma factor (sigma-70 family)
VRTSITLARLDGGSSLKPLEKRLADLYCSHAGGAIRLAYLLTGDREAAEDLCQEAFARLRGKLGALRDPERASGYLFRTVVNLSRGRGRRLQRDRRLAHKLPDAAEAHVPDLAARDELSRALMRLPLRQRTAIFLHFYEDLTEAQAADVLNCTVNAVRSLTYTAMESLRSELKGVDR